MLEDDKDLVRALKALADDTRLEIVRMLCEQELCACHILTRFHITQPTLSYHMRLLTESGLVVSRREGSLIWYTLSRECFLRVREHLCRFCEKLKTARYEVL